MHRPRPMCMGREMSPRLPDPLSTFQGTRHSSPVNTLSLSPERRRREGVESSPFRHIPAKQSDYLSQKGQLKQHYFPEPRSMTRKWSQPAQSTGRAPWQRFGSAPGYTSNPPPPWRLSAFQDGLGMGLAPLWPR